MKNYTIYVDITFSGVMEIEAKTIQEAKRIARTKYLVPSDLNRYMPSHIKTEVTDAFEAD